MDQFKGLRPGQGPHGWHFSTLAELQQILQWRWPRLLAALCAGAMLAAAGNLMQRLTGNAMASPEMLGISSGASLGVILLVYLVPIPDKAMQIGSATVAAFAVLAALFRLSRRTAFSPERLLLTGMAVSSIVSALVGFILVGGDPRMASLLSWMAGSTEEVTAWEAVISTLVAFSLLAVLPLLVRWLEILPLGLVVSRSLGVDSMWSRLTLLVAASLLTAAATLLVGPLSFVGLMAPHMARLAGLARPLSPLWGALLLGALIMLVADWLGRNILFPYEVPAGMVAASIGAPYFMLLMHRQRSSHR